MVLPNYTHRFPLYTTLWQSIYFMGCIVKKNINFLRRYVVGMAVSRGVFFVVTIKSKNGIIPVTTDFFFTADEEQSKREKAKAREMRGSQWWKRKRSTGICYYCGKKFKPAELTMDHLVPIVRGGKSVQGNLVPACKECNTRKKYLLPAEWEEYLQSLKKDEPT
jgi:5-methylcytosine-specific restriction protein A